MFEGKPPFPGAATPLDRPGELRPVSWSDLVARLDAARGLRAVSAAQHAEGDGSFDPGSARRIAALGDGKPDINPDASANGKGAGCITRAHSERTTDGDPRT